jgi:hypothetical protein
MKQADLRDTFQKVSKGVCTATIVVSPDILSPTPSTFSVIKTPENTEEDPYDPEPADKVPKCNTPLISCAAQV